jgi:hypothetical protein
VETRFEDAQDLLAIASTASSGACFVHKGRPYRRTIEGYLNFAGGPIIHLRDAESNELIDVTASEESLFWEWATVEVLRHTGIRIEELVALAIERTSVPTA